MLRPDLRAPLITSQPVRKTHPSNPLCWEMGVTEVAATVSPGPSSVPPGPGLETDAHLPEADATKTQLGHHRDVTSHCPKAEGSSHWPTGIVTGRILAVGEVERIFPPGGEQPLFHAEVDLASLTYILDGSGAADWKLGGSFGFKKKKKKKEVEQAFVGLRK